MIRTGSRFCALFGSSDFGPDCDFHIQAAEIGCGGEDPTTTFLPCHRFFHLEQWKFLKIWKKSNTYNSDERFEPAGFLCSRTKALFPVISSTSTTLNPNTLTKPFKAASAIRAPIFPYEELEASTNQFDPKRKSSDGGFGSVYLGHLFDGRISIVKYIHRQHRNAIAAISAKSFCNEILILSSIDHPNLVKLNGYCSYPRVLLLVHYLKHRNRN
ncbi:LEAF RUST 10 DISEASE-RESISTANCE LOCUS RECEPTOR-LIKE PROTEIN KINASE-like 1.5 [Linum perenne]